MKIDWKRIEDRFEEIDNANHTAKVKAQGNDAKGRGAAVWDFHVSDKVVSPILRRAK